jgi:hypothetical protein
VTSDSTVQDYIDQGIMPQGSTLSAAEIQRIDTWFSCGAP